MTRQRNLKTAAILVLTALPLAGGVVRGREPKEPVFKYAGGTEDIASDCHGRVQLSAEALSFRCAQRTVEVPYATIVLMQYRPDVAPKVRGMNLNWKVNPPHGGAKKNRYFSLIYNQNASPHVIVLEAPPDIMRPYLAEIDLKSGKRVEVRGYEKYE